MYAERFGFSKPPFSVTPDPQVFFNASVYREAFAKLQYGILAKKGFIVVTGEVGTGKTTLLRKLLHSLGPNVHSVFVFNTQVSFVELLRLILDDLGLTHQNADKLSMIEILNRYLIDCLKKGHIVTLLIDEAQNLGDEALEGLRLLSNLETDTEKLLQIVLMGQPELETKLDQPKLRQLRQRSILQCRLTPLKKDDGATYIDFRLNAAGYRGKKLFDHASIEAIVLYSKGIPRLVNLICDNALLAAFGASKREVSSQIVEQLAQDLRLGTPRPIQTRHPVHHQMPAESLTPPTEKPLPEFENVFMGAGKKHWPVFPWKHRLTGWGVGIFVGVVFLGGIALSFSQQSKVNLPALSAAWRDSSQEEKYMAPDWSAKVKAYLADSAVKAQDLSIRSKKYMDAKAEALYRQTADSLAASVHTARDFTRRSKDNLAGLAARMGESIRSHRKTSEGVNPSTKMDEDNSGNTRLADSKPANPSKQTASFGHPALVAEKPSLVNEQSKQPDEKKSPAVKSAEKRLDQNTQLPAASVAVPDTSKAPLAESRQLASAKPEPAPLEHPNGGEATYLGNFEVVENSFVRDKPQDDAEIITTLQPGTAVRVEGKIGKYFRVRTLNDPGTRGYVHEEDAFFERK